jgi:hypothetical protein
MFCGSFVFSIKKKQFFSEEKNQKTFAYPPRLAACRHCQQIKVFWFFSSEKNTFSTLLRFRRHRPAGYAPCQAVTQPPQAPNT